MQPQIAAAVPRQKEPRQEGRRTINPLKGLFLVTVLSRLAPMQAMRVELSA